MSRSTTITPVRAAAFAALTFLSACAAGGGPTGPTFAQVAAQVPPAPPDRARIFFYRDYEPYDSLGRPNITLNGQVAGVSEPGGVFYRDVPPGKYVIATDHDALYPDENKAISIGGGQTAFVKIESLKSNDSAADSDNPETFVVDLVDPADGQKAIASKRYYANGG
jgi:hypothetical protein